MCGGSINVFRTLLQKVENVIDALIRNRFLLKCQLFFFNQKRTNCIKGYLHQAWSVVLAKRDSRLAACAGVLVRRLLFDEGLHSVKQTCNV